MSFDLIVIGGGPGGYIAGIRAAQLGLKVAVVELRKNLGGTCLNVGCIPSKVLLEASHLFHLSQTNYENFGIKTTTSLDLPKLLESKNKIVESLARGIDMLFKKNKITLINGFASFISKNEISIKKEDNSTETISAKNFIIATGSEVATLKGIDIDEERIISSTGALSLKKVPSKMVLIGAGVVGLELGSVWSRFGSNVEVIEYLDIITPSMDQEISKSFQRILEKQGIKFRLNAKVTSIVKKSKDLEITIEDTKTGKQEKIEAEVALVAVGRKPYISALNLDKIGIKLNDRGFIEVNSHFQTNIDNIYAVGDVIPGPMLAHKAEEEGIAAAENIAGKAGHVNYNVIPSVIYTHPEVASIGKTEEELKKDNIEYNIGKFPFMANSRAKAVLDQEGFVKILACKKTDKVLGCHIIGRDAGSLIHEVAVLMEFGGSSEDLSRTCHAHPTFNEAVKEAALAVEKRAIHV